MKNQQETPQKKLMANIGTSSQRREKKLKFHLSNFPEMLFLRKKKKVKKK